MRGVGFLIRPVDLTAPGPANASALAADELSRKARAALLRAERKGLGDSVLLLPQQAHFIANARNPGTVNLRVTDVVVTATRISEKGAGRTVTMALSPAGSLRELSRPGPPPSSSTEGRCAPHGAARGCSRSVARGSTARVRFRSRCVTGPGAR